MRRAVELGTIMIIGAMAIGCAGATTSITPELPPPVRPDKIPPVARAKFDQALAAMAKHDAANDWTAATCLEAAQLFTAASDESGGSLPLSLYNAGLAHQRCKQHDQAKAQFQAVIGRDPAFHRARVQVALYMLADSEDRDLDRAIAELKRAAIDSQYKSVEALSNLAMLQMRRRGATADDDGPSDFERAKKNIQRTLAIDDSHMPAYNLLALYHLENAKRGAPGADGRASKDRKKANTQALELAALVCSQAVRKSPRYAPIHNTSGLVQVELGDLSRAVADFQKARSLDPSFFEAHMNFAAVNLQFRGFNQAEEAYRAALRMRPNDYDAHLGLALALRGQLGASGDEARAKEAKLELDRAKGIAPNRPEAYYNEAILTQEYNAKSSDSSELALRAARSLFTVFVDKAGKAEAFKDTVIRAHARIDEIDQILIFIKQTKEEQERSKREKLQRDAEQTVADDGEPER